jgi:hypothetical protein
MGSRKQTSDIRHQTKTLRYGTAKKIPSCLPVFLAKPLRLFFSAVKISLSLPALVANLCVSVSACKIP